MTAPNAIRTPEHRFNGLPGYDFKSKYINLEDGLRMHYLDEGDPEHPPVLLLHGEPSWSYLYRKMIPILSESGFRVIAPDLIGFGKSDKLIERSDYSYQKHIDWLTEFISGLDLRNMLLFCQDWGGLIGLRLVAAMEDRFSMVVASNTALPTGMIPMPEAFRKWQAYSQHSETFDIGKILDMGTVLPLSEEVIQAYNAPFPSEEYKAGARIFPLLVPMEPEAPESEANRNAWEHLKQWEKPFLTIFGNEDDIMKGAEILFQKLIPGSQGQNHGILNAGHFIQEDRGEELARLIVDFYRVNTSGDA